MGVVLQVFMADRNWRGAVRERDHYKGLVEEEREQARVALAKARQDATEVSPARCLPCRDHTPGLVV